MHLCNGIEYGPCIEYVDDPPPLRNCSKLQNEGKVWEDSALLRGGVDYNWVLKPGGFYIPRSCETNKKFQSYAKSYEEPKAARVSKLLIHSAEFSYCSFLHNFYNTVVSIAYDRKNLRLYVFECALSCRRSHEFCMNMMSGSPKISKIDNIGQMVQYFYMFLAFDKV